MTVRDRIADCTNNFLRFHLLGYIRNKVEGRYCKVLKIWKWWWTKIGNVTHFIKWREVFGWRVVWGMTCFEMIWYFRTVIFGMIHSKALLVFDDTHASTFTKNAHTFLVATVHTSDWLHRQTSLPRRLTTTDNLAHKLQQLKKYVVLMRCRLIVFFVINPGWYGR